MLCEAMLCGCVPVVSDVGAMPEAVAEIGAVVSHASGASVAESIRTALRLPPEARHLARQRIMSSYSRERRRRELFGLLDALLDGERPGTPACDWPLA